MKFFRFVPLVMAFVVAATGLTTPAQAVQIRPLIQGVVVDQGGRYVDDVTVLAVRDDGTVAASALTYASPRPDGPQHGYFFLDVGQRGEYTVTLAKRGYVSAEVGTFFVRRRGVVSLGEVELVKKLVPSTTSVDGPSSVTTEQRAEVTVSVDTAATTRPTGEVVVRVDGRRFDKVDLRARDRGEVEVRLDRMKVGAHTVEASWSPDSPYVRGSESKKHKVTVRKHRRGDRVAVATRAWVPGNPLLRVLR